MNVCKALWNLCVALVSAVQGIIYTIIALLAQEEYSGFYLQLWSQLNSAVGCWEIGVPLKLHVESSAASKYESCRSNEKEGWRTEIDAAFALFFPFSLSLIWPTRNKNLCLYLLEKHSWNVRFIGTNMKEQFQKELWKKTHVLGFNLLWTLPLQELMSRTVPINQWLLLFYATFSKDS